MSNYIPKTFLTHLFKGLRDALKSSSADTTEREIVLHQGMVEGINLIESRVNRWLEHQKNLAHLAIRGGKRMVSKEITLSEGRYRKFEWYEGKRFFSLAFRWGRDQPSPEIGFQIQNPKTLDSEYLVYTGSMGYDDLVTKAKSGGARGIRPSKSDPSWIPAP